MLTRVERTNVMVGKNFKMNSMLCQWEHPNSSLLFIRGLQSVISADEYPNIIIIPTLRMQKGQRYRTNKATKLL